MVGLNVFPSTDSWETDLGLNSGLSFYFQSLANEVAPHLLIPICFLLQMTMFCVSSQQH